MAYVVTIDAKKISTNEDAKFYFSGGRGFTSSPSSSPSNTFFDPRMSQPLIARRDMFDKATTYGAVASGIGEIRFVNTDGGMDNLVTDYATNGREAVVYAGDEDSDSFPSSYSIVQKARVNLVTSTDRELTISLLDKMQQLEKPLLQNKYLGNNVLPAGTEGVKDDLKDRRKPRVYGKVLNISPYFVNTARLIYQVSDKPCTVTAVYSRGVSWTSEPNYTAFADLQNDTLEPNQSRYKVYSGSEGTYIRLGSVPAGTFTCDAETTEKRAGGLLQAIAEDAGISLSEISTADVAMLNTIPYECGTYATEETTGIAEMSVIASAVGAYFSFDRLGILRMNRLVLPSTSVFTIYPDQVMELSLVSTADTDEGIPAWSVTLEYAKNYTVQTDLDDTAATSRAAFAAQEFRKARAENSTTHALYPNAPEVTITSSLISETDAATEADRRLSLLQGKRLFEVSIRPEQEAVEAIDIDKDVTLIYPRFGLNNGVLLKCIGVTYNFSINEMTLRLWG